MLYVYSFYSIFIYCYLYLFQKRRHQYQQPIEQLGSYDPFPNENGEKLCSINIERILYWYGERTTISKPVAELLGKELLHLIKLTIQFLIITVSLR